jgi:hypothetical protein
MYKIVSPTNVVGRDLPSALRDGICFLAGLVRQKLKIVTLVLPGTVYTPQASGALLFTNLTNCTVAT